MAGEWMSAKQIADEMGLDIKAVRQWPKLPKTPLVVYLPPGNTREWRVRRESLNKWIEDTWEPYC